MENTTNYTGVATFIIAYAVKFTNTINKKLDLRGRDDEDIFHELLIRGCTSQRVYREGAVSEKTFVYRSMERLSADLLRKYHRNCRKSFLYAEPLIEESDEGAPFAPPLEIIDTPDIIGQAHVSDILAHFTPMQKTIAELSMNEKSLSEIADTLGTTIGVVRAQKDKMREMLKTLLRGQQDSGRSNEKLD